MLRRTYISSIELGKVSVGIEIANASACALGMRLKLVRTADLMMALGMILLSKFLGFRARTLRPLLGAGGVIRPPSPLPKECFSEKLQTYPSCPCSRSV